MSCTSTTPPSSRARPCGAAASSTGSGCATGRPASRTSGDHRAADRHDDADGPRAAGHDVLQHRRPRQLRQRRPRCHDARRAAALARPRGGLLPRGGPRVARPDPAAVWAEKAAGSGTPATVASETAFLVDFLPVIRRTLTRTGFTVGHVEYYSDALKPWIARRERLEKFVLRRDPRDISRIWALDPDGDSYVQVPYRTLSRPPVRAWEQGAASARMRELGPDQVDDYVPIV